MLRVRGGLAAGALAGVVALTGACSGPAPTEAPSAPATSAPTTAGPSASASEPAASPSVDAGSPSADAPSTDSPSTDASSTDAPSEPEPSVEPSRPVETAPAKKLDEQTRTAGAVVSLESVRTTTVKARNPGDRSGRGVLVSLRLRNSTSSTLDASFVQVGLTDRAGTAAIGVDGPPTDRLPSSVRAGRTVQGTYAFVTDQGPTDVVTVSVYVTEGQPVVTFRGRPS